MMSDLPAVFGGEPIFRERKNIVRPVLPEFSSLASEVEEMLQSGMVTKGRYLGQFESEIAAHLGVKHAVAVSSCTTGLMLAYRGLGLTGEVVVPSFTFMATVSALVWCGLRPVFADVDLGSTNLDPAAAEAAITPDTSAIVAVHNFGNPADIEELEALANRRGLKLIFDAAHGFGALYRGKPVGRQADAQVYSLSPTKLLIAAEGGIVATNRDDLAQKIRLGREYGNNGRYDSAFPGLNARMPEFNALLGLRSLVNLERAALTRNETAALYQETLGRLPGIGFQTVRAGDRCSYKDFSITIDPLAFGLTRDELASALDAEGVDTRTYYDPPVHRQSAYESLWDGRPLPNTDWLASSSLSLPIWSEMDPHVSLRIAEAIHRIYTHAPALRDRLEGADLSKKSIIG
jgi:dTDP-4-amino-4,6-dideoxygalactose transaminase